MNLQFIWIEAYRNFENLNLNFSSNNLFMYDFNSGIIEFSKSKEVLLENFFNPKISSISAIVGENGVGKTSIFALIQTIYSDIRETFEPNNIGKESRNRSKKLNYIAIFESNGIFYQFHTENVTFSKRNKNFAALNSTIENTFLIYYSNLFDYTRFENNKYVLDLSTNRIVNSVVDNITENYHQQEGYIAERQFADEYKASEINEQFNFLLGYEKSIPFKMPNKIGVSVSLSSNRVDAFDDIEGDEEDELSIENRNRNNLSIHLIRLLDRFESNAEKEQDAVTSLKYRLLYTALSNYLRQALYIDTNVTSYYEYQIPEETLLAFLKKRKSPNLEQAFIQVFDGIENLLNRKRSGEVVVNWIDSFISFLKKENILPKKNYVTVDLTDQNKHEFKDIFSKYYELNFHPTFIDMSWEGISSGENAFLSMFSRIYSFRALFSNPGTSVILLFDECETNFHPNWQRKLVSYLNSFLPTIISECNLQIILSSHSPIILSDLPKSNIVFLKRNENGVLQSHLEEKRQTFAANIHTLFSDTFFMNEGLIGDFAKNKINDTIDKLTSRYQETQSHLDEIRRIIDLIGEPVIKSKMTQMLNEKLNLTLYDLNERLKKLEK